MPYFTLRNQHQQTAHLHAHAEKRVETRQPTALKFDGLYGELAQLGLPFPLVVSLSLKSLIAERKMFCFRFFGDFIPAFRRGGEHVHGDQDREEEKTHQEA